MGLSLDKLTSVLNNTTQQIKEIKTGTADSKVREELIENIRTIRGFGESLADFKVKKGEDCECLIDAIKGFQEAISGILPFLPSKEDQEDAGAIFGPLFGTVVYQQEVQWVNNQLQQVLATLKKSAERVERGEQGTV